MESRPQSLRKGMGGSTSNRRVGKTSSEENATSGADLTIKKNREEIRRSRLHHSGHHRHKKWKVLLLHHLLLSFVLVFINLSSDVTATPLKRADKGDDEPIN